MSLATQTDPLDPKYWESREAQQAYNLEINEIEQTIMSLDIGADYVQYYSLSFVKRLPIANQSEFVSKVNQILTSDSENPLLDIILLVEGLKGTEES